MNRRQSLAIAVSVTVVAVLGACGKKEEAAAPKAEAPQKAAEVQTVRIGSASPLTGPQAHIGIDIRNGVQLAVEDANAAGVEIG
jgi:branched-chain amino acid transport system substrate-binding protein